MVSNLFFCVFFVTLVDVMLAGETSRVAEGYPSGFLSNCPGVTKPARISKQSLRHLAFIHITPSRTSSPNKTTYNYFKMKDLAKKLDFTKKTLIYMNGYLDSARVFPFAPAFGTFYLKQGFNVLLVEYMYFSAAVYPKAARIIRPVGERVGEMIAELTQYGLDPKKLQVIGISLGGQGVSFMGKRFREVTGRNISRITSLDPSGPCFRRLGPKNRIDASDADMVDMVHTNDARYGFVGAVGHVNFYINGGEYQLGRILNTTLCTSSCSHVKSYAIWSASIRFPDKFIAIQCDSIQDAKDRNCFNRPMVTNLLGPNTDFSKPGIFYIQTWNRYPFYLGIKGLLKEFNFIEDNVRKLNKDDIMIV